MSTEPLGPGEPSEAPPHRRIAVVPLVIVAAGLIAALVFAAIVWGLAAAPSSMTPGAGPSIPPPTAVAPTPTESSPPRVAGPNECADARGDGTGLEIDSVGLSVDGDALRIVFVLTEPVPESDASLEVFADSGEARFQIAAVWDDGEVDEFFAYRLVDGAADPDSDEEDDRGPGGGRSDNEGKGGTGRGIQEGERIELEKRDILVDGSVIIATVGKGVLAELGDSFLWYATGTLDHAAADACYLGDGTLVPFER